MKHTIRTCIALLLCGILFFSLFPRPVSAAETGSAATVTEETSPTETQPEEVEPYTSIPDAQGIAPGDQGDSF